MKAAYYTLEAGISVFLIMTIFLLLVLTTPTNPEIERANIKTDIYKGFEVLNSKGSLRANALDNNATAIKNDLDDFLPKVVSLHVTLFNKSFNNLTESHTEQTVDTITVSYFISGDVGNYTPKEIRTYVWGFE